MLLGKLRFRQPVRDSYAGIAITALIVSGIYVFTTQAQMISYWLMEVALVSAILAEGYADDAIPNKGQ